jgi:hypothetical protein
VLTAMNGTDSLVIGRSYLSNESGSLTFWTECAKQEVSLIASMDGSTAIRTTSKRSTSFTAVRNVTREPVQIHVSTCCETPWIYVTCSTASCKASSRRSFPQNISVPIKNVGAPNIPRARACSV